MGKPIPLSREVLAGFCESLLPYLGYEVRLKDLWEPPPPPPPPPPAAAGAFISRGELERAKQRMTKPPFDAMYAAQRQTAQGLLNSTADPFHSDDFEKMVFGWTTANPPQNSLRLAVDKLTDESDHMRRLALEFALSGGLEYAEKAVELMLAWAERHTPVNMTDPGFAVDYPNANLLGRTQGFKSPRPWDLALNAMFQTHGLTNACDALLLLQLNGHAFAVGEKAKIREWLFNLAKAVNSSFHAWTKWADNAHPDGAFTRYRSDNHLSWCHVGLLSAAVADFDSSLVDYVLRGGVWERYGDGYANPSHVGDVIDRAIESSPSGDSPEHEGRMYEEKIRRDPPIGYSIYHLTAMSLVAQIAKVHVGEDVWSWTGEDNAGMPLALERYAEYLLGTKTSPTPSERYHTFHRLPWELVGDSAVVDASERRWHYQQAIGPVAFLLGKDA